MELDGYMALAEDFVAGVVGRVLERCQPELKALERDIAPLERVVAPFPRISYDDALRLLAGKSLQVAWGDDLGGDEETAVSANFDRPVFVHRYPTQCKAFYMQPDPLRPEVVLGADLLAPEGYGEIVGGGQRIHDISLLERRLTEHNLPSGGTGRCLTRDSASGSSGPWRGSAGSSTFARRFPSRGCSTGCIHRRAPSGSGTSTGSMTSSWC
jgi:aspartyl/asparaginyl-tRNA synthetase